MGGSKLKCTLSGWKRIKNCLSHFKGFLIRSSPHDGNLASLHEEHLSQSSPRRKFLIESALQLLKCFFHTRRHTGVIKTNTVVNATGVWGKDLLAPHGIHLPLVPMKHAYVISETIKEVQGMPNVRDHDYSTYFRIQG